MADNKDVLISLLGQISKVIIVQTDDVKPDWFPAESGPHTLFTCIISDNQNNEVPCGLWVRLDVYEDETKNAAIIANMKRYIDFRYNGGTVDAYNAQYPNGIDYNLT
jgi:Asp-tRNA(Asn)/Glu-tRNA(Gln) amidotransferase C subunit